MVAQLGSIGAKLYWRDEPTRTSNGIWGLKTLTFCTPARPGDHVFAEDGAPACQPQRGRLTMTPEDQNMPELDTIARGVRRRRAVSALGLKLRAIRREFLAGGGEILSRDELSKEIAERRGGVAGTTDEEDLH